MRAVLFVALVAAVQAAGCGPWDGTTTGGSEAGRGKAAVGDPSVTTADGSVATISGLKVALAQSGPALATQRFRAEFVVYTTDPAKHFAFRAWSDGRTKLPYMRDDLGNNYPAVPTGRDDDDIDRAHGFGAEWFAGKGFKSPPAQQWGGGGITAEVASRDVIYYHPPAPKARRLTIDLPATNVGGTGTLRFVIHLGE